MNVTTKNSARLPGVALLITLIGLSMIGFNAHAASTTGGSVPQSLVDAGEYEKASPRRRNFCFHDLLMLWQEQTGLECSRGR